VTNKNRILSALLYLSLSPIFISQTILANDAEVIQLDKTDNEKSKSSNEKSKSSTGINLEKAQLAEAIWLGQNEEVSISIRHETPISKAPSIVTVITDEEIKNLGYRTFVEILRTLPGFEILKRGDYGTVVPVVRGVEGANKIRVMLNGHFVNYPLWGDAFIFFDDFPV
jgi:outer membrane cobalamin receptor